MTRAERFIKEAFDFIGEDKESNSFDLDTEEKDINGGEEDTLDLGAESDDIELPVEDELDLGSITPTVKVQKEGPIIVDKGDIRLSIADDGTIDISLGGSEDSVDMTDKSSQDKEDVPAADKKDEYDIDWDKEDDKEGDIEGNPKESFKENVDLEGQTLINLGKKQNKVTADSTIQPISKARSILNIDNNSGDYVSECEDQKYECVSCGNSSNCTDPKKKKIDEEDEEDFLTDGYL